MRVLGSVSACLAALMLAGCTAGAVSTGGLHLKRSEPTTSCGTTRAAAVGQVDTVDAGWLQTPIVVNSYSDAVYPPEALAAKEGGIVEVRVIIAPTGAIERVVRVEGPEMFRAPATEVVRGMLIASPAEQYGTPVAICGTVVVTFQAKEDGITWVHVR